MSKASYFVDGTPQKRIFRSIIADYSLQTSVCELIDNAIDHWTAMGRKDGLHVRLFLNVDRQLITVRDNAGGVPINQIQFLIAPGASRDEVGHHFIGNFGVGGKRAGIALGQRVEVSTRYRDQQTFRFTFSDDWLAKDTWEIEVEPVSEIGEGTTNVAISSLRQGFSYQEVDVLKRRLAEIYAMFVGHDCQISVNGDPVGKTEFGLWAFPPDHKPKTSQFSIRPSDNEVVEVTITGGLIRDRDPVEENYGVYIYCNNRLIVAHEKALEVGFYKGEAGVPHPDASLARVIVELTGPPELMPWISNKSGINWSHPTFLEVRQRVVALTSHFVKISRRLKNVREEQVFAYQSGDVESINLDGDGTGKRVVDLPLPRGRKKAYPDLILENNYDVTMAQPWTLGLVEAMGVADSVSRKRLQTKNRISLIILDSNLEIALKEFIVHRADLFRPDKFNDSKIADLFKRRHEVINTVKPHLSTEEPVWDKVRHYYDRRNKLVHERATLQITDVELADYREVVERILSELFDLNF
ncbi:ATP-binding protein [Paracoccus onubensis]|uniref:Histidine kinase n=1 Tax=Paracoccus onubensis TaxID=1675788 RepID=A0A418SM34_9RHOB|nr:ATP-binding protein [Paracoccus onubensis]RJE82001.1 histidine kinase [Paracoccus onubensis]